MFQGRKLIIATKHSKEKVIAPLLEKALGVSCSVIENCDTDIFGTFTGEVERKLDPISTARQKCLMAMDLAGCDLGVASEGSFGPHPSLFFVNADDEFLIFIDRQNNLEIIARELSTDTNFNGAAIKSEEELWEFAESAKFPSHGLILRKAKEDNKDIIKGINEVSRLEEAFNFLKSKYESVYAETDMRAMYNPSRMRVIEAATLKLIDQVNSLCPQCNMPGFQIVSAQKGLKCSLCGSPTQSVRSYIYGCRHCQYRKEEAYPHKKTSEDPMYCDFCNP
jgi:hypothetical protein